MNMFFKKKLKSFMRKKMTWNDVTFKQMKQIQTILFNKDIISKDFAVMQVLYGEEIGDISFLLSKLPFKHQQDKYVINEHTYVLSADITRLTVSQYIDYQASKELMEYLCVCLIPEGHKYNDGYDMEQVKRDIDDMKFVDVNAVSVFLKRQFQVLLLLIADYLKSNKMTENLKRLKLPQKQQELMEQISHLELANMEFSILFYQYAKSLG